MTRTSGELFILAHFLPYQLNQVAELVSQAFQKQYRSEFGLTRTQWRILAHLHTNQSLTAKQICKLSHEDKVSISRGVAALEGRGLLHRTVSGEDRRFELLQLTDSGRSLFTVLASRAYAFESEIADRLGSDLTERLRTVLDECSLRLEPPE